MTLAIPTRKRKTLLPAQRRRTTGQNSSTNVVPTWMFQPELERIITTLQGDLSAASNGNRSDGAVGVLASRLACNNGHTTERYVRRLFDHRRGYTKSVPATLVDRIYQAVGETHTHPSVPLVELPGGYPAALEMVTIHDEFERRNTAVALDNLTAPPNVKENKALAKKLQHFTEGMCLGWDIIDLEINNSLELFFRHQHRKSFRASIRADGGARGFIGTTIR